MKQLLLITGILLSTSLWADMDKQCVIFMHSEEGGLNSFVGITDYIEKTVKEIIFLFLVL